MPTVVNKVLQSLAAGEEFIHGWLYAGGYLWGTTNSAPTKLLKIDPANPSAYTSVTFANNNAHKFGYDVTYANGKVYVPLGVSSNLTVQEVDPVTLDVTEVVAVTDVNFSQGSCCNDGTYLYILLFGSSGIIRRYLLSDFSTFSDLNTGYLASGAHCIRWDGATTLYATDTNVPGRLVSIDTVSFTMIAEADITGTSVPTDDFGMTADYIWIGSEGNGTVARVLKSNFASIDIIDPSIANACYAVFADSTYVWAVYNGSPGKVVRIAQSDLSFITYDFPSGQNAPNEIQKVGDDLWFTFYGGAKISSAVAPNLAFALECDSPPNGRLGVAYTHDLVTTGGTAPYSYTIVWGSLPQGLSIGASTGTISGTPTASGKRSFTAKATDDNGLTATVTCSITVKKCPVRL